jgi:hypothetical protein
VSTWRYVGASNDKVHIYKGDVAILKNVPEEEAIGKFMGLIEKELKSEQLFLLTFSNNYTYLFD